MLGHSDPSEEKTCSNCANVNSNAHEHFRELTYYCRFYPPVVDPVDPVHGFAIYPRVQATFSCKQYEPPPTPVAFAPGEELHC